MSDTDTDRLKNLNHLKDLEFRQLLFIQLVFTVILLIWTLRQPFRARFFVSLRE